MKKISRAIVVLLALGAGALVFGFVLFAANVTRDEVSGWDKADGIVVLTGGDNRLEAGAKLLSEHRAKRMLISGVNRKVRREEMQRLLGLDAQAFNCCVDLGYEALDTVGNADEAHRRNVPLPHAAQPGRTGACDAGRSAAPLRGDAEAFS